MVDPEFSKTTTLLQTTVIDDLHFSIQCTHIFQILFKQPVMSNSDGFFTYRLTNLPKIHNLANISELFNPEAEKAIISTSIGPCPYQPSAFDVATVTFSGERDLKSLLCCSKPGQEGIQVDDDFYGLTPLNTVTGSPQAEYRSHHSFIFTHC